MNMRVQSYFGEGIAVRDKTDLYDSGISMSAIREKAILLGVNPSLYYKADLIHAIQIAEGNTPCFGFGHEICPRTECCFRTDCMNHS